MKIGYDAKRLFANQTGLGSYSRTLVNNLVDRFPEHQYHLYTSEINGQISNAALTKKKQVQATHKKGPFAALWRSNLIKKNLRQDKIDLFHGLSHEIPLGLNRMKIPSIVTIHDLIFLSHPHFFPFIDRQFYKFKFDHSIRNADRIIAITKNTKQDIVNHYKIDPDKIKVVYQSVDPVYFKSPSGNVDLKKNSIALPSEYLLYVGSLSPRKNIAIILEALNVSEASVSLPLVIVGKGARYKKRLLELKQSLQLKNELIFLENIRQTADLIKIYQGAKVFIYPSLYEGFGLPIVESMLCGTPVICSEQKAMMEAGGPKCQYINPTNAKQLASKIETLLHDEKLRATIISEGLEYAQKNFNPRDTCQSVMDLYLELVS